MSLAQQLKSEPGGWVYTPLQFYLESNPLPLALMLCERIKSYLDLGVEGVEPFSSANRLPIKSVVAR